MARLLGLVDAADPPGRGSGRPERDHAEAASVGAQRDLVGARDLDELDWAGLPDGTRSRPGRFGAAPAGGGRGGRGVQSGPPPLAALPERLRAARFNVNPRAILAACAIALFAVGVLGLRALFAQATPTVPVSVGAQSRPLPTAATLTAPLTAPVGALAAGTPGATRVASGAGVVTPPNAQSVVVYVVGAVRRPGVVRLPAGSRLEDAVKAVGGPTAGADLTQVNLARVAQDGEQIIVPKVGEAFTATPGGAGLAGSGAPPRSSGTGSSGGLVNLNTATLADLDTLPGVGPVLAQRIIDWRTEHGRFTTVDELGEVSGIGDKLMSQLRPKVTL